MSLNVHPVCFHVAAMKAAAKRWLIQSQPGVGAHIG
jgi:hypothetical protein